MKARRSLTRRVLGTVLLLELVSAAVLIGLSAVHEWQSRLGAFDVMLRGRAETMLGAVGDAEDAEDNVMLDMTGVVVPRGDLYLVRDDKSGLLGESKMEIPAKALEKADRPGEVGAVRIEGRYYRIIRVEGTRVVDPGDQGGGVRHTVTVYYASQTNHIWHEVNQAVRFYAIATVLLFSATTLVIVWLLQGDLAPLNQLAAEAGKVTSRNWAFHAPRDAKETRELLPLVEAIEGALGRLQRSFEQQRRMTSDAAHELKTDVAIQKSSLQLLTMRPRSLEEYQKGLAVCLDDCARLERTVLQMLTLARVEHEYNGAQGETDAPPVALRDCIEKSMEELASTAALRRVTIALEGDADLRVRIREADCGLMFTNLLMNALQHSPAENRVRVGLSARDGWAKVEIEDEGDGIAADDLPHVFEPFYRGDASRSRESGGTGLGLAICKAICERANGHIAIASAAGAGTKVTLEFPAAV